MTYQNLEVLKFYQELPFNIFGDLDLAVKQIKQNDPFEIYPHLKSILSNTKKDEIEVVDIGCGGGWLVNSLSYHHNDKLRVVGIDYNSLVIDYAKKIKAKLNLNSEFYVSDLFSINEKKKYDLVISLGVLHHTNNCHEAINKLLKLTKDNSHLFIGLYHKYSREPFLKHFQKMKNLTEEEKFKEYKKLHKIKDEKKLYSWFRDQVLHPHETQHTFEEIHNFFSNTKFKIISTSINNFEQIKNYEEIFEKEKKLKDYSEKKLANQEYFPGFFIVCAKN